MNATPSARPRGTIVTLCSGSLPFTVIAHTAWPASWYAVSRRSSGGDENGSGGEETALRLGAVTIELPTRRVSVDGAPVPLTRKEFDLLALLAQRPGVVFRREQIISEVWRTSWEGTGRTLEVHVASLRSKLRMPALIETVRGVGYRLVVPAA